jgi:hypothetical protein
MKTVNWILVCIALFFSMGVFLFITSATQTQDVSKPAISSEQQYEIKEAIKNSQDLIWLDSNTKGEFAWMGYFEWPGEWHYYSLVCGQKDLRIYSRGKGIHQQHDSLVDYLAVSIRQNQPRSNGIQNNT